ncbi:MAG TPA: tRNA preQ1(34) S-adenosylmethionine ribosyltransferase-isomerase QueA [Anaerolineales bacterium]|nr:tRNA preQ1(34) S-adenosylmethionine ribosyltransferase-isomerase QueA [Anaerolineales bacterium]
MFLSDFDYHLPAERIAQTPLEPRSASRMMVVSRQSGAVAHRQFLDLPNYLRAGDLLIFNNTRVLPARILGQKVTGGKVEILLLKEVSTDCWETLVGGKRMGVGAQIHIPLTDGQMLLAEIVAQGAGAERTVQFAQPLRPLLPSIGQMPLPPYIHTRLQDTSRYQTVYAQYDGSAAAPTAGLHFTPEVLAQLQTQGVQIGYVTLHVGLDTFAPVTVDDVSQHTMHSEWCELPPETAVLINQTRQAGGRVVAVGTTSVRTLESAALACELTSTSAMQTYIGDTRLFITPGFRWRVVNAMLTNFHLPKSTLLMLVSAFCEPNGKEKILTAYRQAILAQYRFFSFGDCMLIYD